MTVIDHRDLIPERCLPTFDSGNIESYIHRIPGLTERYFYLNDDVFFGAPVQLADWFWGGGTYASWSDDEEVTDEPLRRDSTALENACRLSNQWLAASVAQCGGREQPSTVFRTRDKPTIVSDFVIRWALENGVATLRDYLHLHVPTGDHGEGSKLDLLASTVGALHFFCVNDTTDDAHPQDPRLTNVLNVLQHLFPHASGFERL